jgi:ABC-type sugar transport system substrate-binding protein
VLGIAVLCALVAAGCGGAGGDTSAPKRKVIGVSLLTAGDAFYKALEAGLREEAAAKGIDLVIVACEKDPTKQASQIEDFVAQHVSAIVLAPCDSNAVVPALAGPERAGIPVFTADISAHGGKVVSHVASDNAQGGRLAAAALAGFMGGVGKVVIIDQPTVASVQDRVRGFEEGLQKFPGITIVAKPATDGNRDSATRVMEDMLQAHREITGVFGINDNCALSAASVVEAAGRKDIAVVGFDATDEAQAAIRKGGPFKADVIQYPKKIGQLTIDAVADFFAGKTVPPVTAVDVGIVDARALGIK